MGPRGGGRSPRHGGRGRAVGALRGGPIGVAFDV